MSSRNFDETQVLQHVAPQTATATVTPTGQDLSGYDELDVELNVGTMSATTTLDVKVQKSATVGGTYEDVTGAAFPQITTANDVAVRVGGVKLNDKDKPFYRALCTIASGTPSVPLAVVFHLNKGPKAFRTRTVPSFVVLSKP